MARVLKREAAKRDLTSQWVWHADNGGMEVADRFLIAVEKTLKLLATQPESGSSFFLSASQNSRECVAFQPQTVLKRSSTSR